MTNPTCTCNFSCYSVMLDDMPDDMNPHGPGCPFSDPEPCPKPAACDPAQPCGRELNHTGDCCHMAHEGLDIRASV